MVVSDGVAIWVCSKVFISLIWRQYARAGVRIERKNLRGNPITKFTPAILVGMSCLLPCDQIYCFDFNLVTAVLGKVGTKWKGTNLAYLGGT